MAPGGLGPAVGEAAGFVIRSSLLVLLLLLISRLPFFRHLWYRSDSDSRTQVVYSLFWMVPALIAPRLTVTSAYVPFFAGRFGGLGPGYAVGAAAGAWLLLRGHSVPTALLHVAAGALGGYLARRLGPGRWSPAWLAPAAAALSLLAMDLPDRTGTWMVPQVVQGLPGVLPRVIVLWLGFSLACFILLRAMDYLMTEGERERADAADRVLTLAREATSLLSGGLTPETSRELAVLVRRALQAPAVYLLQEGTLVAFEGSSPHIVLADSYPGPEAPVDHRLLFPRCPDGCPYSDTLLVPLEVGGRPVAWLGAMGTRQQALSDSVRTALRGLALVLSGMLSQVRVLEQRRDLEEARHRFLQAQIRPHFLFNALNTIASLATEEPRVRRLVGHLASFLRESFRQDRPLVDLEHELQVVRAYLAIEQERFGERLVVEEDLPDPLPPARLPPFTVQPLVENAVRHGTGTRVAGGTVRIRVRAVPEGVEVAIEDDGPGVPPSVLESLDRPAGPEGGGIGLWNVQERLVGAFGPAAGLEVETRPGGGTRVLFRLPSEEAPREEEADAALPSAGGG